MKNFLLLFLLVFVSVASSASNTVSLPVTPTPLYGSDITFNSGTTSMEFTVTGSDGFLRMLTTQAGDPTSGPFNLIFTRCTNATCSTKVSNTIYTTTAFPGAVSTTCVDLSNRANAVLAMGPDGDARVFIQGSGSLTSPCPGLTDNEAFAFVQCNNANCSSSTASFVGAGYDEGNAAVAVRSDNTAYVVWDYHNVGGGLQGLKYSTCTAGSCSVGTPAITEVDEGDCMSVTSARVAGDGTLSFGYLIAEDFCGSQGTLHFWSNGASSTIASSSTTGDTQFVDMALASDSTARVAMADPVSGGTNFFQCVNQACSATNPAAIAGDFFPHSGTSSVSIGADGFPRIVRSGIGPSVHPFPGGDDYIRCHNAACSDYTRNILTSALGFVGSAGGLAMNTVGSPEVDIVIAITPDCGSSGCGSYSDTYMALVQITEGVDFDIAAAPAVQEIIP